MYGTMTEAELRNEPVLENGLSPVTSTTDSPDASSTASDSPTPTNSVHEKNWANRRYGNIGRGFASLMYEDQRQLLGTEEESSDKHSSEGEADDEDAWTVTEDQHEYYEKQFKLLQPDVKGVVDGSDGRRYFEKSRLSVEELRRIWEMVDVTKDGALSLAEFKAAMHLIVARYHGFPLPESLPKNLVRTVPLTVSSDIRSTSPQLQGKEWTKFGDSPPSTVSSPGPKPVNFDFSLASVEKDPKILHPVALRLTPASESLNEEGKIETRRLSSTEQPVIDQPHIKPIQRPQVKKHAAPPGSGAIPPPPHSAPDESIACISSGNNNNNSSSSSSSNGLSGPASLPISASKKDPPPPPPPRPNRTHFRSSSLDLNWLGKSSIFGPHIPPRISPGMVSTLRPQDSTQGLKCFADVTKCIHHGAFHVYKKLDGKQTNESCFDWNLETTKTSMAEGNKYLRVFCKELQEELNALREESARLRCKLESLHSSSPLPSCSS